jgi:hypothetical protein
MAKQAKTALDSMLNHLLHNVLPAARDYEAAEDELSLAFIQDPGEQQGQQAKRRAAEVAIAIDGLVDRAAKALGLSKGEVRRQVASRCRIDRVPRPECIKRVRAVANAYKHAVLDDETLPITSESDVLATGPGYGVDGYGLGKFSGVEVLVHQKNGKQRKFLADVSWSIAGWFQFLADQGAVLPLQEYVVCNRIVKAGRAKRKASRARRKTIGGDE